MSIRVSLLASLEPPLPERDCKGTTFFFPSKSFRNFFPTFFRAGHRRQARQTAEPPVWHAVARLRPQVGFFPVPEQENCNPDRQATTHRKEHAPHGRLSLRSTGGTQPRDATAIHIGKSWRYGGTLTLQKKQPLRRTDTTENRHYRENWPYGESRSYGKSRPDGGCRPNIKKRPDRHSSQASYHIRTQGPCTSLHHAAHSGCRSCNRFLLRNLCNCALSGQEHPGN